MPELPFDPELEQQIKLDAICVRFEDSIRQGKQPEIESFLGDAAPEARRELLRLLLLLELEYALRGGSPPEIENYLSRFPGDEQTIRRAFAEHKKAFEERPLNLGPATAENTEAPGRMIGRYKLLEQIGEGGMGVVYMAEQQQPVRRKVALKIIKPGMDTKQVIARFEAERQALAMMEHANIARVLDAGSTDQGRPYFVMELVRGIAITEYCDEYKLSTHERLELFVLICKAVQHAHTKGIIHRDLKPTNVLVTLHDGVPVPKIIDFGVAKATGQQLTEKTVFTSFSQMVGTPLYMSPEQAEISGLDIDTRSDIYSLGVLLYELLTGTTPFDRKRLQKAAYDEVRRIIREEEPDRPSTRFSTSDDSSVTASKRRAASPAKLQQLLRGELDWIVMKALDKERRRRYETASLFATEVNRYLKGEPVEACPPTLSYRFQKFVKRNKTAVALGLLFVALFCLTAWKWWDELKARRQAVSVGNELLEEKNLAQTLLEQSETNLYYSQIAKADLQNQLRSNPGKVAVNLQLARPKQGARDRRGWEWGYLNRQLNNDLMTIQAGSERLQWINDISFSADGRFFATAAGAAEFANKPDRIPGLVRIFNAATGKQVFEITSPDLMSVYAVALSSDGEILATLDRDWVYVERQKSTPWQVRLWDVRTQTLLRRCPIPRQCRDLQFSPDGSLLAAIHGNTARVWSVATGEVLQDFPGTAFDFSDDSKRIVVSGNGSSRPVIEFDPSTGEQLKELECAVAGKIDPTQRYAVRTTSRDKLHAHSLFVDSFATGRMVYELRHESTIWDFDYHPIGHFMASAGGGGVVRHWDLRTGMLEAAFAGHHNHVSAVAYSPRGDRLVSGDWNGTVKVWDVTRHPEHMVVFDSHPGSAAVENMSFEPGGERIVGTWQYYSSHVYMIAYDVNQGHSLGGRGGRLDVVNSPGVPGQITAFNNPATIMIGVAQSDQTKVKVWEVADGSEICTLSGHSNPVQYVSISNDGLRASCAAAAPKAGTDGQVLFWDIAAEKKRMKLSARNFRPTALALNHDGSRAVIAGSSSQTLSLTGEASNPDAETSDESAWFLEVWDVNNKTRLFRTATDSTVNAATFSPDGDTIASAEGRGPIQIRQTETGDSKRSVFLPGGADHLAFSPDGRRLAGATRMQTTIWDTGTGHEVITLRERQKFRDYFFNPRVVFSEDGKLLATSQWDSTAWIRSAKEITEDSRAASASGNIFRSLRMNRESFRVPARFPGWWAAALETSDANLRLHPKNTRLYARRAAIQKQLGNVKGMLSAYERGREAFDSDTGGLWITGNGDHVAAPHIPFDQYESFTIELWVKNWSSHMLYQGYGYEGLQGKAESSVWLARDPGRIRTTLDTGKPDFQIEKMQAVSTKELPGDQWVHVAVVYDSGQQSLFIGGKRLAGPKQIEKPGPYDPARPFWIGYQPAGAHNSNGLIRSFRISQSAVYKSDFEPAAELQPSDDTVLLYDFSEMDPLKETVVPDLSGNGNDGQIRNAWWIKTE